MRLLVLTLGLLSPAAQAELLTDSRPEPPAHLHQLMLDQAGDPDIKFRVRLTKIGTSGLDAYPAGTILQQLVNQNQWPQIKSENAYKVPTTASPPASYESALARLPLAATMGFQIRMGKFGNILCDSWRKYILVDQEVMELITGSALGATTSLAMTAVFAHELGHYLHDLHHFRMGYEAPKSFNSNDELIAYQDASHAEVELLACELMKHSGLSRSEIRSGYDQLFSQLDAIHLNLTNGTLPSSNLKSRRGALDLCLRK